MKYLINCLLVIGLSASFSGLSVEISQQQWLSLSYTIKTEPKSNETLPDEPKSAKDIMLVSRFIEELRWEKDFTARQLHQLNKWRRSDAVLVVLPDTNDKQPETLIDIAAEAKATFLTLQSRAAADEIYQKWQRNEFTIKDLDEFDGVKGKAVFKTFFNRLPLYLQTGFKDWSMEKFQDPEITLKGDYSAMLAHMATMLGDMEVGNFLLQSPVTENTMEFLDKVPESYTEQEQLTLLKNAAQNSKLMAKSFNLLAQHFPKDTSVAVFIADALKERSGYWQALTVVPAFAKVGNVEAFENVMKALSDSQQEQLRVRLKQRN